jgi:hypothetical protein
VGRENNLQGRGYNSKFWYPQKCPPSANPGYAPEQVSCNINVIHNDLTTLTTNLLIREDLFEEFTTLLLRKSNMYHVLFYVIYVRFVVYYICQLLLRIMHMSWMTYYTYANYHVLRIMYILIIMNDVLSWMTYYAYLNYHE